MATRLTLVPEELRAAAAHLAQLSADTEEVQQRLRSAWQRLDAGWHSYARDDVDFHYGRANDRLRRLSLAFQQLGQALTETTDRLVAADQQAASEFSLAFPSARPAVGAVPDPQPPIPPPPDAGSGAFGGKSAEWSDRAREGLWRGVAAAADRLGYDDAARHMRHYLDGSGQPLQVEVGDLLSDLPQFRQAATYELSRYVDEIRKEMWASYSGQTVTRQFQSGWLPYYARRDESPNWFFALGGFHYSFGVSAMVVPPSTSGGVAQVVTRIQIFVNDTYNWDHGKGVNLGPAWIPDETLGELHQAGLAHEFAITGKSDLIQAQFSLDESMSDQDLLAPSSW